jgi:uncharacterized protein
MALSYTSIPQDLIALVRSEFALSWDGIHGVAHWARVRDNGLRLAELTGANPQIVELFAFLHDAKRCNDGKDPGHGKRGAAFARSLRDSLITLPDEDMALLTFACEYHTDGLTEANVTIQTCWDADRLDLGRVGVKPNPRYLCTPAARDPEMIKWAFRRSRQKI